MNSYARFGFADISGSKNQSNSRLGGIQVIVINRDDRPDRMSFQEGQLERLGLTYLRLEAYTPETMPSAIKQSYWSKWRRPLTDEERAKFLSHSVAWDWVKKNGPALIIEDDAVLAHTVPEILLNLENIQRIDHLSLEVRGRRKLVGNASVPIGHGVASHRLYLDRLGSAAYVLWPRGAEVLISKSKNGVKSTNGMAQWSRGMRSYQSDPACAVQLDMAEQYGLTPPEELAQTKPARRLRVGTPVQRIRFILAQAHKLARRIRYSLVASRREIPLRPEFFDI